MMETSVGSNVIKPMLDPIFYVTAYAWVLLDTFALQEDITSDTMTLIQTTAFFSFFARKVEPRCKRSLR